MIGQLPVQYLSLAILIVNVAQLIATLVIYFKGRKK